MWIFENPKLKPEWLDSERGEPEEEEVGEERKHSTQGFVDCVK